MTDESIKWLQENVKIEATRKRHSDTVFITLIIGGSAVSEVSVTENNK